ncbi:hypothetical protein Bca52824_064813 [Brassica carinata]|uniref:Uncharacterized protein n=1 Tax=Brassica carinata TaxID=52824 RepID=A0A8X7QM53_BRACI|nr:hypothetical protein Bca52824_064813 [Brassica carinata]
MEGCEKITLEIGWRLEISPILLALPILTFLFPEDSFEDQKDLSERDLPFASIHHCNHHNNENLPTDYRLKTSNCSL